MVSQGRGLGSFVYLQNSHGGILARGFVCRAADDSALEFAIISIVHHAEREDATGVVTEERWPVLRVKPVCWVVSIFESVVPSAPEDVPGTLPIAIVQLHYSVLMT